MSPRPKSSRALSLEDAARHCRRSKLMTRTAGAGAMETKLELPAKQVNSGLMARRSTMLWSPVVAVPAITIGGTAAPFVIIAVNVGR